VRATAGGVTSIIDPTGRVVSRVDPQRTGDVSAMVPRLAIRTPHDRWGLAPLALLCLGFVAVGRRKATLAF
jgi:apolipoprotein N-acyltransferase